MTATINSEPSAQPHLAVDVFNAALGATATVESAVRFQMARGLLRYYELVWKGEAVQTPSAERARASLQRLQRLLGSN